MPGHGGRGRAACTLPTVGVSQERGLSRYDTRGFMGSYKLGYKSPNMGDSYI